jgi:hypothetical protein
MSRKALRLVLAPTGVLLALTLGCSGEPTVRNNMPRWTPASGGTSQGGEGQAGSSATGGSIDIGPGGAGGVSAPIGGESSGTAGAGGQTQSDGNSGEGGTTPSGGVPEAGARGSSSGGSSATSAAGGVAGVGGASPSGGATGSGGSSEATFDWGTSSYNPSGGSGVAYQGHFTGQTCVAPACHRHNIKYGGTLYQSNGLTTAGNVQIGLRIGGSLTITYSGSQGNFYGNISGTDWANATIAVRNARGTSVMPGNAKATGDCNNCHSASNRIVVP